MSGDSWETTSGLLDDYIIDFEEVWFSKPASYQEGKATVLQVRGTAYDPEDDSEVLDDEKESFYSLGDGWEPDDGGESATHGAGKTKFNKNSSMGRLIEAVVGLGPEVLEELKSRGDTTDASTWRGLRFLMHRFEFEFKDRKTGETRTYSVDLPTEFLGVSDDGATKKKSSGGGKKRASGGPKKEAAKEEAPKSSGRRRRKKADDADEGADSDDDGLRDAVIQFAAEWEDHDGFMETVLDPDEFDRAADVQANEELLNEILDPDGELWAASREIEPA